MSMVYVSEELLIAAAEVAGAPPERAGQWVSKAQVPYTRIERLRAALDAQGINWRGRR